MEYQDFLFELGTEELPPKTLQLLSQALTESVTQQLTAAGLTFSAPKTFATPRRLGLFLSALSVKQADKIIEKKGPAVQAAFKAGKPTPAMLGFAKSCGVAADALETIQTDKGERLVYRSTVPGKHVRTLMPEIINTAINALPIAKRMRWGMSKETFVRPVHWVVMLLGDEIINTTLFGLNSERKTWGHRVHAPQALIIKTPAHYENLLKTAGKVMTSFEMRRAQIKTSAEQLARQAGGTVVIHDELLDEITALTEWPVALTGTFDRDFLKLPREVIAAVMEKHQKYFFVNDAQGNLLPVFICIANLESQDTAQIIAGNERVIRPRLADAQFFYETDLKKSLISQRERLKTVVFQKALGTLFDKTTRIAQLAKQTGPAFISETCTDSEKTQQLHNIEQAALLCKSDLVCDMVAEFPELQGITGRYYAQQEGLPQQVSLALQEQYLPRFSGDALPTTTAGKALALAEKIDTLVGMFGINKAPSGNKDPFSLRRLALGAVRIIIEQVTVSAMHLLQLDQLISQSIAQFQQQGVQFTLTESDLKKQLTDFMLERLKNWSYSEQGISTAVFLAVKAAKPENLANFYRRMQGVQKFCNHESALTINRLVQANKRIANILSKSDIPDIPTDVNSSLLQEAAEKALYEQLCQLQSATSVSSVKPDQINMPEDYLSQLAVLKDPVDQFFDQVMVNVEDLQLRRNRYALLQQFRNLFLQVADISFI